MDGPPPPASPAKRLQHPEVTVKDPGLERRHGGFPGLWTIQFRATVSAIILTVIIGLASCGKHRLDPPPHPYQAFVANRHGRSVAVVDLAEFKVVASLQLMAEPEQMEVRPGSHEVYAVSPSGWISVISFPELRLARTMRVGNSARDLQFSPDGGAAYVLEPETGQIVFLEGGGRQLERVHVDSRLSHLALAPDGKTLVAGNSEAHRVYVVDTQSRKVLGVVAVGRNPGVIGILPDSSKAFVADAGERAVTAIDLVARKLLSHLELSSAPSSLIVKPDGGEIFVLSITDSTLTILDAFHDNVEQTLTTGREPAAAVLDREASVLYIASAADGSIIALDAPNRTVLASTHVGISPNALALTPDERYLVATDPGSSSLAVLRTERNSLVTTIPVGDQPVDVVIPAWERK